MSINPKLKLTVENKGRVETIATFSGVETIDKAVSGFFSNSGASNYQVSHALYFAQIAYSEKKETYYHFRNYKVAFNGKL